MNKQTGLFFALILLLFITACKPAIDGGNNNRRSNKAVEVLKNNREMELDYKTLELRGKGRWQDSEQNLSFTYKIAVVKDSVIYGSISKLGFEAYKMLADPDSVRVRNTLEKKAEICDYSLVKKITGFELGFYDLQHAIVGDLVQVADTLHLVGEEDKAYHFEGVLQDTRFDYYISAGNSELDYMEVRDERRNQASRLTYSEYTSQGKQQMPNSILFEVLEPMPGQIELSHTRVEIDPDEVRTNFRIPSSYAIKYCGN